MTSTFSYRTSHPVPTNEYLRYDRERERESSYQKEEESIRRLKKIDGHAPSRNGITWRTATHIHHLQLFASRHDGHLEDVLLRRFVHEPPESGYPSLLSKGMFVETRERERVDWNQRIIPKYE